MVQQDPENALWTLVATRYLTPFFHTLLTSEAMVLALV